MRYIKTVEGYIYEIEIKQVAEKLAFGNFKNASERWNLNNHLVWWQIEMPKGKGYYATYPDGYGVVYNYDTLEELCDEFVCKESHYLLRPQYTKFNDDGYTTETYHEGIVNAIKQGVNYKDYHWFGAIWTDKGLIYVAEMKGILPNGEIDWELL